MVFAYDLILPVFLFGSVFSLACLLLYTPKPSFITLSSDELRPKLQAKNKLSVGEEERLLLPRSDSIENHFIGGLSSQLSGQFYLLTCDLADAPTTSLQGQFYQLVCRFSDIPQAYLRGQCYQLSCDLADVPASSLQGQSYPLASVFKPTWHDFYRQNLGRPNINYWQWRSYPEVKNICSELTLLIDLPMPKKYDREILESLAAGTNLFLVDSNWRELDFNAKFARRSPQIQQLMRQSFKKWHETGCILLGRETMQAIYQVCYRTSWAKIIEISQNSVDFNITERATWWQVLGVAETASSVEVVVAYKKSIGRWHPDLNPHPDATTITTLINIAYEKYRAIKPPTTVTDDRREKINRKIFQKLQNWLKPIFSR
jgi:DnaJ domain